MEQRSQCRARWSLISIALIVVIGLIGAQPSHVAALNQTPSGWRTAGALPYTPYHCIEPSKAHTLLVAYNSSNEANLSGSYAFDWVTGQLTRFSERPFTSCSSSNGLLFSRQPAAGPPDTWPVYRFSLADPQPRRVDHEPSFVAADGTQRTYALSDGKLWASEDAGLSWKSQTYPIGSVFAMVAADARALYRVTTSQDAGVLRATVAFSPDGGATWEPRGTLNHPQAMREQSAGLWAFESRAAPVDTMVLTVSNGGTSQSAANTVFLSIDGGRTFNEVGTAGFFQRLRLFHTGEGVLRLTNIRDETPSLTFSSDGGRTWTARPLPAQLTPPPSGADLIQLPNAPSHLLLNDANSNLWHSPDGGRSWQLLAAEGDPQPMITPYAPATMLAFKEGQLRVLDLPDAGRSLTAPVLPLAPSATNYAPETKHNLSRLFQPFWANNGGLAQFGYPTTEPFYEINPADGHAYLAQYFERNRFEYHPEHTGTAYEVQLGLLGSELTAQQRAQGAAAFNPVVAPANAVALYFAETGHTLDPHFRAQWESKGGLSIYGYPISEAFREVNAEDGQTYLVQYFERNRFEYHPEHAGTPYEVQLGLLGNVLLRQRGWLDQR